jgi:hypothetical protein
MNNLHSWSCFLSTVPRNELSSAHLVAHAPSSFPFNFAPAGLGGFPASVAAAVPGIPGVQQPGIGSTQQGMPQNPGIAGGQNPGAPGGYRAGMPLSQPPPKPSFDKMYVKTTPIESFSALVSTTHISFLWTVLMLASGCAMGMACMAPRKKGKEDEEESDDDSSSSSSDSK